MILTKACPHSSALGYHDAHVCVLQCGIAMILTKACPHSSALGYMNVCAVALLFNEVLMKKKLLYM